MDYTAHTIFPFERAYRILMQRVDALMLEITQCSRREMWVLLAINNSFLSQRQISAALGIHPNVLVKIIDEMEQRELLVRSRKKTDRREQIIKATEKGKYCLEKYAASRDAALCRIFRPLNKEQIQQWRELSLLVIQGELEAEISGKFR